MDLDPGSWGGLELGLKIGPVKTSSICSSARAHVHTALLYLRNGSADCVQIWYVGWGSLKGLTRL